MSRPQEVPQILRCPKCFRTFRGQEAIETRPVDKYPDAQDIGLICPHCERWVHVAYTSARLEERRNMLHKLAAQAGEAADPDLWEKWKRRQRAFKRDFDALNRKIERRRHRTKRANA